MYVVKVELIGKKKHRVVVMQTVVPTLYVFCLIGPCNYLRTKVTLHLLAMCRTSPPSHVPPRNINGWHDLRHDLRHDHM